jgi:hypothetical protein
MKDEHLSDDELQMIAIAQQKDPAILLHVENCACCQEQIAVYKLLILGLNEQPAPEFDFDLTGIVLQQLPAATTKKAGKNIKPFVIAAFVALALYFFRNNFLHLATGISSDFLLAGIIACLCILVFKAVSLYRAYQRQIEKLNFSD